MLTDTRILAICAARVLLFANFMTVAATIPLLMVDWAISATAAGTVVTVFTIGYAVSVFGFGWVGDYLGARRMVAVSALAAAVTSLAFGLLARDWWSAVFLYGFVGLAQGGVYTPLIMVLSDEVEAARRGNAMGWLIASTSLGYMMSLVAAGIGVAWGGWQAAFMLAGILPAVGAIILVLAVRPIANRVHPRPSAGGFLDELLRNRQASLLNAGYVAHSWELLGMWAWIPAFLVAALVLGGAGEAGATVTGAWMTALLHAFGAVAAFTMGRLSDRVGRRPVLIALGAAGALASFTIGWLVQAPMVVLVPIAVAYAFVCLGDSPVLTTALSETVRPGYLGAVLAWRGLAGFGIGALAPLAVGVVLDLTRLAGAAPAISWGLAFATLGLGGVLALVCALALRLPAGGRRGSGG